MVGKIIGSFTSSFFQKKRTQLHKVEFTSPFQQYFICEHVILSLLIEFDLTWHLFGEKIVLDNGDFESFL